MPIFLLARGQATRNESEAAKLQDMLVILAALAHPWFTQDDVEVQDEVRHPRCLQGNDTWEELLQVSPVAPLKPQNSQMLHKMLHVPFGGPRAAQAELERFTSSAKLGRLLASWKTWCRDPKH